jgi:hypothetical protein
VLRFSDREGWLQTAAVLTDVQNRMDPNPTLPQTRGGGSLKIAAC